eukprot:scaffold9895_cov120-Isochrysis_galbana.AAC.3
MVQLWMMEVGVERSASGRMRQDTAVSVSGFAISILVVIEGNPMLLLGNDFLASHAAVISLSSKDSEGTIKPSRSAEGKDVVLQVSTGPRVGGAYSISSVQTI